MQIWHGSSMDGILSRSEAHSDVKLSSQRNPYNHVTSGWKTTRKHILEHWTSVWTIFLLWIPASEFICFSLNHLEDTELMYHENILKIILVMFWPVWVSFFFFFFLTFLSFACCFIWGSVVCSRGQLRKVIGPRCTKPDGGLSEIQLLGQRSIITHFNGPAEAGTRP